MSDRVTIISPEKVSLSFNLASLGSRIGAKAIDIVAFYTIVTGLTSILSLFAQSLSGFIPLSQEIILGLVSVLGAFSIFLYFCLTEAFLGGQTFGKMAMRLRVVMSDGTPVRLSSAIYRNLLLIADLALPFISLPVMFFSEKCQRPGDFPSGTIVVHEPSPKRSKFASPHLFGIHPHEELVGPLRGMVLEEYIAIKRLCDRFPELSPSVQQRSIEEIWIPFANRFKIPVQSDIHPIYLMEATVMKYGRMNNLS